MVDKTNNQHDYSCRCFCKNCVKHEKEMQKTIVTESNNYMVTSGPYNVKGKKIA